MRMILVFIKLIINHFNDDNPSAEYLYSKAKLKVVIDAEVISGESIYYACCCKKYIIVFKNKILCLN